MSLVDRYNEAAALAALTDPIIETRLAVTVKPSTDVLRYVQDSVEHIYDTGTEILTYMPMPFAKVGDITSGAGTIPDIVTITLDASDLVIVEGSIDDVLQEIVANNIRDRPISISLLVLNIETKAVIGIIPRFVGFVDEVILYRDKNEGARLEIACASYRGYSARQVVRTYGDTDHETRFPGDRACRWVSSAVSRKGKYFWNSTQNAGNSATVVPGRIGSR